MVMVMVMDMNRYMLFIGWKLLRQGLLSLCPCICLWGIPYSEDH